MLSTRSRLTRLCLTLAVVLSAAPALADEPLHPEAAPSLGATVRLSGSAATGWDSNVAVAAGPGNRWMAVWGDRRDDTTRQIYGQLVAGTGASVGWNFRITGHSADQGADQPAIVWNPSAAEYLVVWADDRNHPSRGRDIYGQRLAADGARIGPNFRISGAAALDDEDGPDVAVHPSTGRYLVVWHDDRKKGSRGADIYGQIVGPGGARIGNNLRVSGSKAVENEWWPAVAAEPGGSGFLVAWRDERMGGSVFAQRVTGAGNRVGPNRRISAPAAKWANKPDVASGPAGAGFLVVWTDSRDDVNTLGNVYGQRVRPNGTRKGAEYLVSGVNGTREDEAPTATWDPSVNRWLVAWWEHAIFACARCAPPPGGEARILGRRLGSGGKPLGGRFPIYTSTIDYPTMNPASAWNPSSGKHLVGWTDEPHHQVRGSDIFARTVRN